MESWSFIGGGGHQPISFFKRFVELSSVGLNYNDYFKFGFVRNPYDRFMSAVTAHYMGHGDQNESDVVYPLTEAGFSSFVTNFKNIFTPILDDPPCRYIHLVPQYKFLTLYRPADTGLGWDNEDISVDFVGRYENLYEDWKYVCEKIGAPAKELKKIRINSFQNYNKLWTRDTRELIYQLYKKDFDLFKYEK